MKAVVLEDKGVMTYKDVPTPEPGAGQVRVKIKSVSIAGSRYQTICRWSPRVQPDTGALSRRSY
jgi:threonine dehydrogenase-like Zn-dependent dehydrogenase